jgi:hypothetical protein
VLSNPEDVERIVNARSYKEQPNLDIYAAAFRGVGLSNAFAGTDVDGFFGLMLQQPVHGAWERNGYVLIQEHKKHQPETLKRDSGQVRALAAFANISEDRICVVFTFGNVTTPVGQKWQRLFSGGRWSAVQTCTEDPETWPHRQWLRKIVKQESIDLPISQPGIAIVSGDPAPTHTPGVSCFHCGKLTTESFVVGSLDDPNDSYRMCAICWRNGIDPGQSKRQWSIKIAKQIGGLEIDPPDESDELSKFMGGR